MICFVRIIMIIIIIKKKRRKTKSKIKKYNSQNKK